MDILCPGNLEIEMDALAPDRSVEVHIAFTVDEKYVQHMGVAITSLIVNNPKVNFTFHIIFESLPEADLTKLKQLSAIFFQPLHLYKVSNSGMFDNLKEMPHISKVVYYRLLLPYILPSNLVKVIFLDADLVCCGDIRDLWKVSLNNSPIAARIIAASEEQIERLNLNNGQYLNAGVLVMNLPLWRKQNITSRILKFMLNYPDKIVWLEQDALAVVLEGQIQPMDESFNTTIDCSTGSGAITENTVIVHFVGACKPWQQWCPDDRKKLYWVYLRLSPWYEAKPEDPKTVIQFLYAARLENARSNPAGVEVVLRKLIQELLESHNNHP